MNIELDAGAVRLSADQILRLRDSAGRTVCALEGTVWITEEDQPRDIVLEKGACYRLKHAGLAIINPLGSIAAVSLN